jgi:hypothetical protein
MQKLIATGFFRTVDFDMDVPSFAAPACVRNQIQPSVFNALGKVTERTAQSLRMQKLIATGFRTVDFTKNTPSFAAPACVRNQI